MVQYQNKIQEIDQLKKEIDALRPLSKQTLNELKEYYRIGLTYTSNALEGNSLTETETKIVLEEGITIGGKLIKDHLEALGHSDAYTLLQKLAKKETFSEHDIKHFHKLFYNRIDAKNAGKYRKVAVFITGTDFVPPLFSLVPGQIKQLIQELPVLKQQHHPVAYAALFHLKFVTIHPFVDGNGRCARLLMNLALLQADYGITPIPPVVRADYIAALKQAQVTQNTEPFVNFISAMVYEAHKEYLRLVQAIQGS